MPHTATDIAYVTPTACALLGAPPPEACTAMPCEGLLQAAGRIERLLIYAPDAIGMHLLGKYTEAAHRLRALAPHEARTRAVSPSVTPVCFASMFTGMPPDAHGITRYEKPVLSCDTIFDALARAGRRVAIVAVKKSSIDIIFRGRAIDYFSEEYDPEVTAHTLALLEQGAHDVILAYHQEYDDALHRTEPESPECLAAFRRHCDSFATLCEAARRCWRGTPHGVAFTPDHGAHYDAKAGRGMHGSELEADMELAHFWGFS